MELAVGGMDVVADLGCGALGVRHHGCGRRRLFVVG
jgi:hypothetical protein